MSADGAHSPATLPALVVGCGVIARYHLRAMWACRRFTVAAVADASPAAAEAFAKEVAESAADADKGERPAVFATLGEALEADPDAELFKVVFVLVPNVGRLHVDLAKQALAAGRHVMLEKPLATNLEDAKELIEAAEATAPAAHLMVAENAGEWHAVLEIDAAFKRGDIGDVHAVRAKFWESAGGPWADCYKAGGWQCTEEGAVFDSATHWLRPLRVWLGEVDEVVATASRPIARMKGPSSMQALLRFKSGTVAVFESILAPAAISDQSFFSLQGTKGELVLGGFDGKVTLYTGEPSGDRTWGKAEVICESHWDTSYAAELASFGAALIDGVPFAAAGTAAEAARDLALIEALMTSAAADNGGGGWLKVPEV